MIADREKAQPSKHPACQAGHVPVRMTREYPAGVAWCVATCPCGWTFRTELGLGRGARDRDDAVTAHWADVIAKAEAAAS